MIRSTLFTLAVVASAGFGALAAEAAPAEQQTVSVSYADLDLSSDAGIATLSHRIATAAAEACGPVDRRNLAELGSFTACRHAAIAAATPKLDAVVASIRGGAQVAAAPANPPRFN